MDPAPDPRLAAGMTDWGSTAVRSTNANVGQNGITRWGTYTMPGGSLSSPSCLDVTHDADDGALRRDRASGSARE